MIYLDNNATTAIDPEVLEEMGRVARLAPGNPGSPHAAGRKARQILEQSRETIAAILNAKPDEVIFTSGGTESSNLAIRGLTEGRCGTVLLPPGEHPATDRSVNRLMESGWKRRSLSLDRLGRLDPEELVNVSLEDVKFVTSILAHNETGVIHNVAPLAERCRIAGIPFHVDAVQAVGKIDVDFQELGATTLAAAAHKFHGPRGVGVLLVRERTRLIPQLHGGFQEQSLRPGTEPVMLAAGMAMALKKWHEVRQSRTEAVAQLRDRLQAGLLSSCPGAVVNGDTEHRLPNTLHMAFPSCSSQALLVALDLAGICCSLGSACASGSTELSPVLLAMGLPDEIVQSSLRLSVSKDNTPEEIDRAVEIISRVVSRMK